MKTRSLWMMLAMLIFGSASQLAAQSVDGPKYGEDSVTCVTNISIYREYYKQWEANKFSKESISPEMITAWRYVFLNAPKASELVYTHGAKIVDYLIRSEKNAQQRNHYLDTLIMLHDARALYFPTKGKSNESQVAGIIGRKGHDIFIYNPNRHEEAYVVLKEAIAMDSSQLQAAYYDTYFRVVVKMAEAEKLEKMDVIEAYEQVSDILDAQIAVLTEMGNERSLANYQNVKSNVDSAFEPFATCEDLVRVLTPKMEQNPDDVNILKKITTILDKRNCTDTKLFLDASIKLHELQPSPESAYLIARRLLMEEKYNQAATYMKEATASESVDRAYNANLYLARIYMQLKNYPESRAYARKAIAINANAGEPYILIGDLYAASAKDCGSGDFYGRTAYWAAVDKYVKAKQVDPSVAQKANERIASYTPHFPTTETIFFNDFAEGDSYTVECWINETTTIRGAK